VRRLILDPDSATVPSQPLGQQLRGYRLASPDRPWSWIAASMATISRTVASASIAAHPAQPECLSCSDQCGGSHHGTANAS
jgi:hypothetical protein